MIEKAMNEANLSLRQKRPHRKSRNGCLTCKKRRVKCDESLPQCKVCSKRGICCRYAEPEQVQTRLSHDAVVPASRIPCPTQSFIGVMPSEGKLPKLARRAPDALLWQYYLAVACRTIAATSTDPGHTRMWVTSIPAIAFNNPVTSHALMAFSAFCLSASPFIKTSTYDLRATAGLHYCQAVKSLRSLIPTLHAISADAVLACAMILIPCGIALSQSEQGDCVLQDWLHHLRGWRILGSTIYESHPKVDPSTSLIPYPQPGIPDPRPLSNGFCSSTSCQIWTDPFIEAINRTQREAMSRLRSMIAASCPETEVNMLDAYISAIRSLEYVIKYILEHEITNMFRAVFAWAVHIPSEFIRLLTSNDDIAQAVYAHWLVLVMTVEDLWWVKDFGSGQIERLAAQPKFRRLPGSELLRWPVEMWEDWRNASNSSFRTMSARLSRESSQASYRYLE